MALNNISELSTTAASNSDFAGTSILGTGLVSTADDSFRNLGSFLAKQWSDLGAVNTVGGTANAITITTPTVYTALKTGMFFYFTGALINTGAVTLNLDGIGAKAVRVGSDGTDIALIPGDIRAKGRYLVIYDSTANSAAGAWMLINAESNSRYAPGTLYGLTLSNNSGTPASKIDIAAGACRNGADTANIDLLSALTAKDLATVWAVGSSAGLLDTGAVADGTYNIFLIKRPDTGVVDAVASTSAAAPTLPTNYTLYRYIGQIFRTGGTIKPFIQTGDQFDWVTPTLDRNTTNPGTAALTTNLSLPQGRTILARILVGLSNSTSSNINGLVSSLAVADITPTSTVFNFVASSGAAVRSSATHSVRTNTASQIRVRVDASGASDVLLVQTLGWIDTRDRI